MPDHNGNIAYLHPLLRSALPGIKQTIKDALPSGWSVRHGGAGIHRTPNEQFEIYKKGRTLSGGKWVKTGTIYTSIDGFTRKSRHNYLPATAVDIILFKPDGTELSAGPQEKKIGLGAARYGLDWGGNWTGFTDLPHIEIPPSKLFGGSLLKDEALQWQKYLYVAGNLGPASELDGLWGDNSRKALNKTLGTTERTPAAWKQLFDLYGPVEALAGIAGIAGIPKVTV